MDAPFVFSVAAGAERWPVLAPVAFSFPEFGWHVATLVFGLLAAWTEPAPKSIFDDPRSELQKKVDEIIDRVPFFLIWHGEGGEMNGTVAREAWKRQEKVRD